ncbi:MAG: asparagine synthase (glutamine-hydrolyzing) [Planctomycetales bacterium]|nr:asparagine synthase (glutamine-hydrolyzing) [Planctomycetales bacterium]
MCGIAGIINRDHQHPADTDVLSLMLQSIIHRGPDDQGELCDRELAMGMRRLSIIDLSTGQQPLFDESGRYGVVFNGEIYNFKELREELLSRGHQLKTHGDGEVIVHLFEEHGPKCVDFLRGMFAFAVWDNQQRELFIARDRMGIKPLYYTETPDGVVFGSEIKSILHHPQVEAAIDLQALGDYLSLKYVPGPRTMFQGIRSLPPGHSLTIKNGKAVESQYWNFDLQPDSNPLSEAEYADQLESILQESVNLRLRSDVPFGAFLSGGIDSSIIVALMSRELSEPVKTFSVGFAGGDEPDELPYARMVADQFKTEHFEMIITADDFVKHSERVMWHLDQPIADQATIATYMVAHLASQHVKMVLTGEGGDELFAGYARYVGEQYSPWFKALPGFAGAAIRSVLPRLQGLRRQKIALHALSIHDEATRMTNWFPLFNGDTKREIMTPSFSEQINHAVSAVEMHLKQCRSKAPLNRMLYSDSKTWLPDYLLLRGDKLTMANSLEARVPLLDHKLVEFAATLPTNMKLNGKVRKYLLKKVAARYLPDGIIHRKKQGFPIPIDTWLRNEARPIVNDLLSVDRIRRRGLFSADYVSRLVREHESSFADHSLLLWGLISVEQWMERYIDSEPTTSFSSLQQNIILTP